MCEVQIKVFMNEETANQNKRLFERIVTMNDAFSVPYEMIIKAMRFLYGGQCIISFLIK